MKRKGMAFMAAAAICAALSFSAAAEEAENRVGAEGAETEMTAEGVEGAETEMAAKGAEGAETEMAAEGAEGAETEMVAKGAETVTGETAAGELQEFQPGENADGQGNGPGGGAGGIRDENFQGRENGMKGDFQGGAGGRGGMEGEMDGKMGGRMGGAGGSEDSVSHYSEAADKFGQYEYTDEETGATIPYNLFLPEGYDEASGETYPLVIFIADAGANSNEVTDVLKEDGATVWATDAEQEKHKCIVLAPQYTLDLVNSIGALTEDTYEWSTGLTLVSNLVFHIMEEYRVDETRVYGTGQSQGGMTTIALSDKYPDLYRAQLLVACQWNTEEMSVMKDDSLWIVVCEGDSKAYPGMNEATDNWEALGTDVAKSEMWDSTSSEEEFAGLVADMEAQGCSIRYTVFEGGSHTYTWSVAYTIEGIRDWLFAQQ